MIELFREYVGPFLKDYASPVAWTLVALGWHFNNKQENNRSKRKEIQHEIANIERIVRLALVQLQQHRDAIKQPNYSGVTAVEVIVTLRELDLAIPRLLDRGIGSDHDRSEITRKHEAFFDFASGDDSLSVRHLGLVLAEETRINQHSKAHLFIDSLHRMFLSEFDKK